MIVSTFLMALANIFHSIIQIYIWVIIISALLSWVRPDPFNPIVSLLYRLTEPAYALVRRVVPTAIGGFDVAPIIVLLGLQFIDQFAITLLYKVAAGL
ncbi:YggT family protein [Campylobacter sp. 19-13652]|uniref:YggT family protein n=1 Tax=Campylobacter sp. 19-13652 TaxID=2840180 RepID=UPI001C799133|nr:YggT family protein [Campylobacter sp. 19-13652]BCX79037.1 membrane protein [Campylobacter sp. 19-13652]